MLSHIAIPQPHAVERDQPEIVLGLLRVAHKQRPTAVEPPAQGRTGGRDNTLTDIARSDAMFYPRSLPAQLPRLLRGEEIIESLELWP